MLRRLFQGLDKNTPRGYTYTWGGYMSRMLLHAAPGRKAVGVDASLKEANRHRLRRIEGQVRGLQKMVEQDRYCPDVIIQIASVQEALRAVARNLMRNHLHHCAGKAIRSGKKKESEAMYDELLELIYKHLR
jgi:CsoR family transcriptional regulator, copper-sensing transcriptional repressor